MKFKMFTDKDSNQSLAINSENVKFVRDSPQGPKIYFADNSYVIVSDSYLEAVARLNEK